MGGVSDLSLIFSFEQSFLPVQSGRQLGVHHVCAMADSIGYHDMFGEKSAADKGAGEQQEAGPSDAHKTMPATAAATAAAAPPADFSTALASWREIQLPGVQSSLETLCPSLIDAQKDALLSRKKLAEQTREYKKLPTEGQAEQIKPLLKAYQSEIDSLTKRAKAAENAVLGLRDRLQGAVDPYPLLELLLEQTAAVADAEAMRTQLQALQSRHASLEAQVAALPGLEADKKRLTERLSTLEASTERRLAETRKSIESELSAKWDERIRNHTTREESLTKTLELTQAQLKELRTSYAKATERLLSHGEQIEREEASGKIEELDVISEELSRSNERVVAMERRNEQLRQEMERLKSNAGENERIYEAEQRAREAENETRRLAQLLEDKSTKSMKDAQELARRIAERESQLREKSEEVNGLRVRIQRMSDYDEIKRELEIFKYVEFAIDSDRRFDDEDGARDIAEDRSSASAAAATAKPLEALLIEKNRSLQDELTSLRVSHTELTSSADASVRELEGAKRQVSQLKKLNARLEDDLVNVKPGQEDRKTANAGMSAEEALAEIDKIGREAGGKDSKDEGTLSEKDEALKGSAAASTLAAKSAPVAAGSGTSTPSGGQASSSILPIITSQRDRFRARNAELEEELRKQFATITELRSEVKTLQGDNLGLYEKVRYLQAYNGGAQQGGTSFRGHGGGSRILNMTAAASARDDPRAFGGSPAGGTGGALSSSSYPPTSSSVRTPAEDKYRDKYEASMNPFEQFRGHEQSRALHALNPLERLLHMVTRIVLGHRRMRIVFVIYAVSLHLLVFAMLFEVEFATSSS